MMNSTTALETQFLHMSKLNRLNGLLGFSVCMLLCLFTVITFAQTTLINPAGNGGFETGSSMAANNWTVVNSSIDGWEVGTAAGVSAGTKAGFISANDGVTWNYSQFNSVSHIYQDITIPAGHPTSTLTFKWKVGGEGSGSSNWDNMQVYLAPTSVTPVVNVSLGSTNRISGAGAVSGMYKLSSAAYNSESIALTRTPGTYRLIFSWKSDVSDIANPPAAVDEISFVANPGPALDLGATALITPMVTGCYTSTESVFVRIMNHGSAMVDFTVNPLTVTTNVTGAATATLTGTLSSGTLVVGATVDVPMSTTLNMSGVGVYTFNASSGVTGDGNTANNAMAATTRTVGAFTSSPWSEDLNTSTSPPTGWNTSGWSIATTHGLTGNGLFRNLYSGATTGTFNIVKVGPVVSGDFLSFDYRIVNWSGYPATATPNSPAWGSFLVQISTDCGATYTTIHTKDVSNHIATTAWVNQSFDLSANAGQSVIVRINAAFTAGDYYIDFDNFKIESPPDIDLGATALIVPTLAGCFSAAETVTVSIFNYSASPIDFSLDNTTVTVSVTGATIATLSATLTSGTLAASASQNVTMTGTLDMSATGTYTFNSSTSVAGDGNAGNDAMAAADRTLTAETAVPWSEGFATTSLPAGWSTFNFFGSSTHGNPGNGFTANLYSGATTSSLTTLKLGPIGANQVFRFDYRIVNWSGYPSTATSNSPGWGDFDVEISTDCGFSYSTLETIDNTNHTSATTWSNKTYSLASFSGQNVIFRISASWLSGDYYLDVDNFAVTCLAPTVTVTANSATTFCSGGTTELTASGASTYTWSPTGGLDVTTGAVVNASPSATTTYTVTGDDGAGCIATATETVTILVPPANADASASVSDACSSQLFELFSSVDQEGTTINMLTEGFEAGLPANWVTINNGTGNNWNYPVPGSFPRTGSGNAIYQFNLLNDADSWFITDGQSLTGGVTYTVTFWTRARSASFPENLKVTVGIGQTVADQTTTLIDMPGIANTIYAQHSANFTPSTSGTYYFGWNCYSAADKWELFLDDISIDYFQAFPYTYNWTSDPAGYTSSDQSPTDASLVGGAATEYTVEITNANGCVSTASTIVNLEQPCTLNVTLRLYIEALYTINDSMNNNGAGGSLHEAGISTNPLHADTVRVSVMDPITYATVESVQGILMTDGWLAVQFYSAVSAGSAYYIKVNHRNTIETWSATPVLFSATTSFDFTTSHSQAYGGNMIEVGTRSGNPVRWALYSGDIDQDGDVDMADLSNLESSLRLFLNGYFDHDLNGDNMVESADFSLVENNIGRMLMKP